MKVENISNNIESIAGLQGSGITWTSFNKSRLGVGMSLKEPSLGLCFIILNLTPRLDFARNFFLLWKRPDGGFFCAGIYRFRGFGVILRFEPGVRLLNAKPIAVSINDELVDVRVC